MGCHVTAVQDVTEQSVEGLHKDRVAYYSKNLIKLDSMQKRFTRMVSGLKGSSYNERLDRLGLFSVKQSGDLTEGFKIMRSKDKVNGHSLFPQGRLIQNQKAWL